MAGVSDGAGLDDARWGEVWDFHSVEKRKSREDSETWILLSLDNDPATDDDGLNASNVFTVNDDEIGDLPSLD